MSTREMELSLLQAEVMINEVKDILYIQRKKIMEGENLRSDDPYKVGNLLSDLHEYLTRDSV